MKAVRGLGIALFVSSLFACASAGDEAHLVAAQDVIVSDASGERRPIKKGEIVTLDNGPLYVEAPGHVGVLLAPLRAGPASVEVRLKPILDWGGDALAARANEQINTLTAGIVEAQLMLQSGQADVALTHLERLRGQYPQVTFLGFLQASCLVMLSRKAEAVAALEVALKDFPAHVEGNRLYTSLTGKPFAAATSAPTGDKS